MSVSVSIELYNELGELERLRETIERLQAEAGLDPQLAFHLQLVCDELVTNTISYAYPKDGRHGIVVTFTATESEVEIRIVDEGVPFDPFARPDPDTSLGIDERGIGGLGIYFVRQVMDEVAYTREDGCNVVRLAKKRR
ncbi:MAG: ATP-binding protein [Paenibacillaceae bacterium]|uniref:ATP-binding protein n=1 Tax=Paenibacillus cymbidii TaxID=1639034 RepID=UPI00143692FF|nr:ATP-binding protein [Paenibacillus cymbidii]MBO9605476.1 ATP-binding protein [Paenibacillaceae bacterium]